MSCFSSNQLYFMYWFEICKLEFSVCLSFVNNFSSILPTFIVPSQSPRPGTSWEICNSQCFDQCYQRQWSSHFHPERLYLWSPWNRASEQYNSICLHSSSGLSHQGKSDRVNSDLLWMHYKCKCYTMEKNSTLISVQNPYTRKLLLKLCIKCIDLHALFLCKCVNTMPLLMLVKVIRSWLNFQGSLVYEEEGDGLAMSYFALDRNTGAIRVQKSLLTTNESYFEVTKKNSFLITFIFNLLLVHFVNFVIFNFFVVGEVISTCVLQ